MHRKQKPTFAGSLIFALGFLVAASSRLYAEASAPAVNPSTATAPAAALPTVVSTAPATPTPVPPPAPVPAPPPAAVTAPVPAGGAEYIGAETCLSCHKNRENFKDSVHGHSLVQAKGIPFEKTCETCHGPGSLHAAAAGDRTNPGFATIKNFKGLSAVELEQTCLQCHADENRLHWIGSRHEARNVSCLACHSIHDAKNDKFLLVQPRIEQVCAACHSDIVAKVRRSAHMPVEEGKMECTSCHNPHGSATPKMLNADSANDTCFSCHADKRGPWLWDHPPVRENCLNCHDPHGSHNEKMLVARLPFLCQRCHSGSGHVPTPYDQTSINALNARSMTGSCTNCHPMVHGSNHPSGQYFTR